MFEEYPKVIHVGRGTFTVKDAAEEARYRAPVVAAPVQAAEPESVADVSEELPAADLAPEPVEAPVKKKAPPKGGKKK